jgi:ATP-dependent Clp protease ATP-binding subunit ClpC
MDQNDPQDIFSKFSPNARRILISAQKIAQSMDSALGSEHILLALAVTPNTLANSVLKENLIGMDQIRLTISLNNFRHEAVGMTEEAKDILEIAAQYASQYSHHQIDTEHLLLAIVSNPNSLAADIISRIGADAGKIKLQIKNIFSDLNDYAENAENDKDPESTLPGFDQFMESDGLKEPLLPMDFPGGMPPTHSKKVENFAYDLTLQAKEGKIDPLIGRAKELERVIQPCFSR